jgi:hypothetical protein
MKRAHWVGVVLALVAAVGCTSRQVRATAAAQTDFAQYRTFGFLQSITDSSAGARLGRSPAGKELRRAITERLEARGYSPAPSDQAPDFWIAINDVVDQRVPIEDFGYYGPTWGWPPAPASYPSGTIVVDFVDRRSKQAFWRGTAARLVEDASHPDVHEIGGAVARLIREYPAQRTASAAAPARM